MLSLLNGIINGVESYDTKKEELQMFKNDGVISQDEYEWTLEKLSK